MAEFEPPPMTFDPQNVSSWGVYAFVTGAPQERYNQDAIKMAEWLAAVAPWVPHGMLMIRRFSRYAGLVLNNLTFSNYLDLAAGLPESGYLHTHVPATTRVVYNDRDPAIVAYGRQLLPPESNTIYLNYDATEIDAILDAAAPHWNNQLCLGIMSAGWVYFEPDDDKLAHAFERLYERVQPGSVVAISSFTDVPEDPGTQYLYQVYERMGIRLTPRKQPRLKEILGPWRLIGPGFLALDDMVSRELGSNPLDEVWRGRLGFGAFLVK